MDTKEEVLKITVILFLADHLLKIILLVKQIRIIIHQVVIQEIIQTHRTVDHTALLIEVRTTHQEGVLMDPHRLIDHREGRHLVDPQEENSN
tara:strand:- start:159 stop:434 length:276 start_codon:yes stop_codon:yes gene_type:complete